MKWIATYYDNEDNILFTETFTDRTEHEAFNEASGFLTEEVVDWSLEDEETVKKRELLDEVLEAMKKDFMFGELEAVYELLQYAPIDNLIAYLPEEQWEKFKILKTKQS